jgi:hypothetical protein
MESKVAETAAAETDVAAAAVAAADMAAEVVAAAANNIIWRQAVSVVTSHEPSRYQQTFRCQC